MTERVLGPAGSPRRRWTLLLPLTLVIAAGPRRSRIGRRWREPARLELRDRRSGRQPTGATSIVDTAGKLDWATIAEHRRRTRIFDLPTGYERQLVQGRRREGRRLPCPTVRTTAGIPNNKSDLLAFGGYKEPVAAGQAFLHAVLVACERAERHDEHGLRVQQVDDRLRRANGQVNTDPHGRRHPAPVSTWTRVARSPHCRSGHGAARPGGLQTRPHAADGRNRLDQPAGRSRSVESDGLITEGSLSTAHVR